MRDTLHLCQAHHDGSSCAACARLRRGQVRRRVARLFARKHGLREALPAQEQWRVGSHEREAAVGVPCRVEEHERERERGPQTSPRGGFDELGL